MKKILLIFLTFIGLTSLAQCNLYVPNGFTPNNDGVNDYWQVSLPDTCYLEYSCYVFNRYGQVVWESKDPNDKWFLKRLLLPRWII